MIKSVNRISKLIAAALVVSNFMVTGIPSVNINAYAATVNSYADSNAEKYGLTKETKDGAILHAWCWSFNTIKENMADIAAAGFSSVQTSPANECLSIYPNKKIMGNDPDGGTDGVWWFHYQPTDWKIGNYQLGTRDEFKAMCDEAEKYGIKVIVDVLPNHTTPTKSEISKDFLDAVGGMDNLYHANGDNEIQWYQYKDRYYCTTGKMGGLPDVNTENPNFQKYFVKYLNDCIDCGADGFRYDTAKHIGLPSDPLDAKSERNNFWPVVTGKESVDGLKVKDADRIFNYGEVLQEGDCGVKEGEYVKYLPITASKYGESIREALDAYDFNKDRIMDYKNPASSDKLITWVESHDTYCNAGVSAGLNDWKIRMGWALIAARKDGTPLFYSRPNGSAPGNRWGYNVLGARGNDEFKNPEVVAVNKFRNAMVGESEYLRNINGSNKILAIERGDKGEVIINLSGETPIDYDTNLKDGEYKDQVSGRTFKVSNHKISGKLDGGKIAVIYNNNQASVSAEPGSRKFSTDSIDVKLNCKNVKDAKYSIDGKAAISFTNGHKINIGADKQFGEEIKLTVTGVTSTGSTISNEYVYKKIDNSVDKAGLYFKKPSGWGNDIKAYIYDEESHSSVEMLDKWPGVSMKSLGNGEYFYELPKEWNNTKTRVIFNDGSNQTPGAKQPGLLYDLGKAMKYEDGDWYEVPIRSAKVESGKITTNLASPQSLGNTITISTESAKGGSGDYTYEFAVNDKVIKAASSDKTAVWKPNATGNYTIKVTATDSKGNSSYKTIDYVINEVIFTKEVQVNSLDVQPFGLKYAITADAASKSGNDLMYKFYVHEGANGWRALGDFSSSNTAIWTPSIYGPTVVWVEVKDQAGNKDIKFINYSMN